MMCDVRIQCNNGWRYALTNVEYLTAKKWANEFNANMMGIVKAAVQAGLDYDYENAIVVAHNDNTPV